MISRHADSVHFSGYITRSGPNQFKIEFHDSPVFESKIIFAFRKKRMGSNMSSNIFTPQCTLIATSSDCTNPTNIHVHVF